MPGAQVQWERAVGKAKEHRDAKRLQKLVSNGAASCEVFYCQSQIEKGHGRIETRKCTTIPATILSSKEWKGIASLARIERERIVEDQVERETTYYISSLSPEDVEVIGDAAREHWGVENGLHWRLDVVFRQDKSRYRNRIGAHNLATIRKMVLNGLSKESSLKGGVATKQCAACCNAAYRDKALKSLWESESA